MDRKAGGFLRGEEKPSVVFPLRLPTPMRDASPTFQGLNHDDRLPTPTHNASPTFQGLHQGLLSNAVRRSSNLSTRAISLSTIAVLVQPIPHTAPAKVRFLLSHHTVWHAGQTHTRQNPPQSCPKQAKPAPSPVQ